jgi:hypothetical protein
MRHAVILALLKKFYHESHKTMPVDWFEVRSYAK